MEKEAVCNVKVHVTTMKNKFTITDFHRVALSSAILYVKGACERSSLKDVDITVEMAEGYDFEFIFHNISRGSYKEDSALIMNLFDKAMLCYGGFNKGGSHHFFGIKLATYEVIE